MRFAPPCVFLCGILFLALQWSCGAKVVPTTPSADAGITADANDTVDAADARTIDAAPPICVKAPEFQAPTTFVLDYHSEPPGSLCRYSPITVSVDFSEGAFGVAHIGRCNRTDDVTLTEEQVKRAKQLLQNFCEIPLPSRCMMDGTQYVLTLGTAPAAATFLFDDYNCHKRTDVRYARGAVESLLKVFVP